MLVARPVASLDISAASGLVALPDRLCLVADDETFLAVYALDGTPLPRIPMFPDALPDDHELRKARKPDLESLALLPDGRVLALGSGSTRARRRGALVDPIRPAPVRLVDLDPLFDRLGREVPDLNVEGATVIGDRLCLLQRGNGAARFNALIELDLSGVLTGLEERATIDPAALRGVVQVLLGDLDGVALSFTDAFATADGRLGFTAAAEDTTDPYLDGVVTGSVVGVLEGTRVVAVERVDPALKLEGIAPAAGRSSAPTLWLVADPDDRDQRAGLYRAPLPFA